MNSIDEPNELAQEISCFCREEPRLLKTNNLEWALIKGDEIIGCWLSYGDALSQGYERFGLNGFMVQQVGRSPVILNPWKYR